ncbi:hypothetical protein [Dawidia soli]|uniref:Uncharacterized protein n=1 Tax=Dawidia soli TaxID=2782352 RepID=A0AAP2GIB5_9BACT|nr:hypothetical protein [Dawidia soli]MBT1688131.1 hypothetical protein [Dawidia soli]
MPKPAARLELNKPERISDKFEDVIPEIRFKRGGKKASGIDRSQLIIIIPIDVIGDVVEHSDANVPPDIQTRFRDAKINVKDFFLPQQVVVEFKGNGTADECQMILKATLPTKVPGTGG